MRVSISTLLTLTLLVAVTVQAGRVALQCRLLEIETRPFKNHDERAVSNTVKKRTDSDIYAHGLSAESPAILLNRAQERHDALLSLPAESKPLP